jgi:DNA invertase Pin-like site-specific DNA recombinase
MLIGYARTSTTDQKAGLEDQIKQLVALGCDPDEGIFKEQISSVADRPELTKLLAYLRKGDTLIVTKLDRLARSTKDLLSIVEKVQAKGAMLKILDLGIDTTGITGKLLLTILGGISQFEREIMLDRQRVGIAKAKADLKFKGRKPTARAKAEQVIALRNQGIAADEIAHRLEIGRSSVYRILEGRAAV